MNKKEVIKALKELECEIAEVICDISRNGNVVHPNESILVSLVSEPCNDDLVQPNQHWYWCESIDDFDDNVVYGEDEARKAYCDHYVSEFKEVKEFKTDF
jgi:hypothetical protein